MSNTSSILFKNKIILVFLFVLLICSCNSKTANEKIEKPNIIFIMTDDQGWGDLSLNGNPDISTPNIDDLAKNGVVFENFYVSPVCSPTRAEILTGRYAARGGVYSTSEGGERLDLDETTFVEIFKRNGYKTGAFGKWHNGMQYPYHPMARGFDEFYGFCSGHWGSYFSPVLEHNGELVRGEGFLTDDLTNKAIAFMTKNKKDPFLVYLPLNTPHSPMQVPDLWWDRFKNKKFVNQHENKQKENIEKTKAAYALCENVDWNVGKIVKKVEELGIADNTIIIFLSDNGPNGWRWNGGMKGIKGSTDEGGIRSPFIMQWKGKIAGQQKIKEIAGSIDLFSTLTEMANLNFKISKPLDGRSFKALVDGNSSAWEDRYIVSHWGGNTSVRNQRFRLNNDNQLFDMETDVSQKFDVSNKYPEVYLKMVEHKMSWESNVLKELPLIDERTMPIGHPDFKYTQIPARDGKGYGNIKRSNRWPNCSYFTNWSSTDDFISWDVDVIENGSFEVVIYYTCKEEDLGTTLELRCNDNYVVKKVTSANDPPLIGSKMDRIPRGESYVKEFKPLHMGQIVLKKGNAKLVLKSTEIIGGNAIEFRTMVLKRI